MAQVVQAKLIMEGDKVVLFDPTGEKFLMPIGGDVHGYIRKGFTFPGDASNQPKPLPPLQDGDWAGCRCFIIGGGPSLKKFDWRKLDGELTIGINRAVESMAPTVSFSIDRRWYEWTITGALGEHAKSAYEKFTGHKVMVRATADETYQTGIQAIGRYPAEYDVNTSMANGISPGGNSGFAAINLALCLGASEIYLLGFDCNPEDTTQKHYHDGYPEMQRGKVYKKFASSFNMIPAKLKKLGSTQRIINVNRDSKLTCFEFGDLPQTSTMPLVVSYYTLDYKEHAKNLIASLDKLGLEHDINEMEDLGFWEGNCQQKADYIFEARKRHPGRAVVWIDADAVVKQYPAFLATLGSVDFAAHRMGNELISGTLYFAPTANATKLIKEWISQNRHATWEWDQRTLDRALATWDGKQIALPPAYCRVFDSPHQRNIEPIIEHRQAGRGKESPPAPAGAVYVEAHYGIGDNLHDRVFVKDLAQRCKEVYVQTTTPFLYWDIPNVKFLKPYTKLRVQNKHLAEYPPSTWARRPKGIEQRRWDHSIRHIDAGVSIPEAVQHCIASKYDFSFPLKPEWVAAGKAVLAQYDTGGKPVCLVKWPTVREEWRCDSRNPKPEYMQRLIDEHKDKYFFLSLADLEDGKEWFDGDGPKNVDATIHNGLPLTTLFGLASQVGLILCSPSLFMLMGIALKTPTFAVWGGHLPPWVHAHAPMDLDRFGYVAPKDPCACGRAEHDCKKTISEARLLGEFDLFWAKTINQTTCKISIPPGLGDLHWVLLKLEDFKRRKKINHLTLVVHEDSGHKNSHEFVDLIPFVDAVQDTGYLQWHFDKPPQDRPWFREKEHGCDYMIEFNSFMEQGKRIELALPDCECNWDYEIADPPDDREWAREIKARAGDSLILFYASSCGANNNWARRNWTPEQWIELAGLLCEGKPKQRVVLLGAEHDKDYTARLLALDKRGLFINLVAQTNVPKLFALLREADAVVAFPSGVAIMATHFKAPTVMFYPVAGVSENPQFNPRFATAWVDPQHLVSGKYMPVYYGDHDCNPTAIWEKLQRWV